jgi:hypothetical protein
MLWYYTALWNTVEKLYLEYGFADACAALFCLMCGSVERADGEDPPVEKGEYTGQIPVRAQSFWRSFSPAVPDATAGHLCGHPFTQLLFPVYPWYCHPFLNFEPEPRCRRWSHRGPDFGFSDHASLGHWTLRCEGAISHTSYFPLFFYLHSYLIHLSHLSLCFETLQLFGFPTGPQDTHETKECCFAPMSMTSPMMDSVLCSIPTSRIFSVALRVPDSRIVMPAYTKIFAPRIILCHRITAISSIFFNAKEFRSSLVLKIHAQFRA